MPKPLYYLHILLDCQKEKKFPAGEKTLISGLGRDVSLLLLPRSQQKWIAYGAGSTKVTNL
jgi:hypothetical protein